MRKDWFFYAIVGAVAIGFFVFAVSIARSEWKGQIPLNTQIDQTNFVVNDGCSGTLVNIEQRWILTAYHCAEQQYRTVTVEDIADDGTITERKVRRRVPGSAKQIVFDNGLQTKEVTYRTEIVRTDKDKDLALLKIVAKIPNLTVARIACEPPVRGDEVYIVGNPSGLYASVVRGIVSSDQRAYEAITVAGTVSDEESRLMQISGGVVGGNSGGAVYSAKGDLIGVPVLANRANEVLGFAVPLQEIHDFFKVRNIQAIAHCLGGGK